MTEINETGTTTNENSGNEEAGNTEDTVTLRKDEYTKLSETVGSLKRELKDLRKAAQDPKDSSDRTETKPEGSNLLEKAFLRTAGIIEKDEVEEALRTAKKWGVSVDALVDDEDFQLKLDKMRTAKANALATSDVKGDQSGASPKFSSEYWIAKGVPPTADQVPDRKTRVKIARAMIADTKNSKKFYND